MEFFAGTLTREGGGGVLRCALEGDRLFIRETLFLTDPNYVIRAGGKLYAVSSDMDEGGMKGCVNEIAADSALRVAARQTTSGNAPCFLCASPDGRFLYCPNYGTGSLCVYPLEGGLGAPIQHIAHSGSGPNPARQAGPHIHQATFIPGTQYLVTADLGTDSLVVYRADEKTGLLTHHSTAHIPGGPRHLAYGKPGTAYLVHELSNEISVLRIQDGVFTLVQTLSMLPEPMTNLAAAVRVSADGRTLYASNRGHGSIAVFDIDDDGLLALRRYIPAGAYPRDFVLLENDRILIADQRGGLRLVTAAGEELCFLEHAGAVCVCMA